MTIAIEKMRALEWTREFLYDLLDPRKTKRVPLEIRRMARAIVKHLPCDFEIKVQCDFCRGWVFKRQLKGLGCELCEKVKKKK